MTTCKYFGVRTGDRESKAKCQKCKEVDSELFVKCTVETNILMGTSISVDEKGNTILTPPAGVSDTELMFEKYDKPIAATQSRGQLNETYTGLKEVAKERNTAIVTSSQPKKKASCRVKGLVVLCRNLKSEGKSDDEIRLEVAKRYVLAGKNEKEAAGKAKNWVKNMNWNMVGVRTGRLSSEG